MPHFAFAEENILSLLKALSLKEKYPNSKFTFFKKEKKNLPGQDILLPFDDFFRFLPRGLLNLLKKYIPDLEVREISLKKIPPLTIKEGYSHKFPLMPSQIYRTSILFFTEKLKIFFALRKKYSLWQDIPLYTAAKNLLGEGFADYIIVPFCRYRFLCEAEDVEFSLAFPKFYEELQKGISAQKYYEKIRQVEIILTSLNFSMQEIENRLKEKLKDSISYQNYTISRYKGKGYLQCGSREFGPFTRVIFPLDLLYAKKILEKDFAPLAEIILETKVIENTLSSIYFCFPEETFSQDKSIVLLSRKEKFSVFFFEFLSNLFKDRFSDGQWIRCVLPGKNDVLPDNELADFAIENLKKIFKIKENPREVKIYRHIFSFSLPLPGQGQIVRELEKWALEEGFVEFLENLNPFLNDHLDL